MSLLRRSDQRHLFCSDDEAPLESFHRMLLLVAMAAAPRTRIAAGALVQRTGRQEQLDDPAPSVLPQPGADDQDGPHGRHDQRGHVVGTYCGMGTLFNNILNVAARPASICSTCRPSGQPDGDSGLAIATAPASQLGNRRLATHQQ
jgi:hypothetical protein